jgi:hypothetical protein
MDPKETMKLISHIMEQSNGGYRWSVDDYGDDYRCDKNDEVLLSKDEAEDFDRYLEDAKKYRAQTRLLAQRKKEVISLKKKLANRVKKLDGLVVSLSELVEKYGDLENSADLMASVLMELGDDEEL